MSVKPMWKVVAEKGGLLFDTFKDEGIVALGIEELGDLSGDKTRNQIAKKLKEKFPQWSQGKIRIWAGMLMRFFHEMKQNDYVVTYDPGRRKYLVGLVKSDCRYEPDLIPEDPYIRSVNWVQEIDRDALSTSTKNSLGAIATLIKVPSAAAQEILVIKEGQITSQTSEEEIEEKSKQIEEIEAQALELTKDLTAKLDWEQMQQIVAGLLRAMGYKTRVSTQGSDRGKDIVASPDGLGFEDPRIAVEVKHRSQTMGSQELRSFLGGRHPGDKGLFVSTGGFTKDAYYEAERANIPMTLMNLNDLVQELLDHYEQLDIETQRLVPLKRIYWPIA